VAAIVRVALLAVLLAALPVPAWADTLPPQIHTVAGGGSCSGALTSGGACDNVSATSVPIGGARDVAAFPDGSFLFIDAQHNLVREVSKSGKVITVAGNGTTVDAPDGTLAVNSGLDEPVSIAPLPGGGFLVTEFDSSVVRVVSPGTPATATITTVAGTGTPGAGAQSGPATSIQLNHPADAEPNADGTVLIADTYNNYIRLLSAASPGATISTIAGGGACDDAAISCDGQVSGSVGIHQPDSVSPLPGGAGGFLFAEYNQDAVRQVSAAGAFSTVAGTPGRPGYAGDGGPAAAAQLDSPKQVVATADGGFLIADTNNEVIRQVSPSGTIATIAGNGNATFAGDGGAATAASLQIPDTVAPTTNGGILIADSGNGLIREVTIPPVSTIKLTPSSPDGANGWYISPVTATVKATEKAMINCELDPTAPPPAFGALSSPCPFTGSGAAITDNGVHLLWAASQNSFGDAELPVSMQVKVDTQRPTVTCGQRPKLPFGSNAEVTATLSDSIVGPSAMLIDAPADTSTLGPAAEFVDGPNNAGLRGGARCAYDVVPRTLHPTPVAHARFAVGGDYATVRRLDISDVPSGATVGVTCVGSGCPFPRKNLPLPKCQRAPCGSRGRTVSVAALFRQSRLAPGSRLAVSVTQPYTTGWIVTFTIRSHQPAKRWVSCLALGSQTPGRGC
jgi:hypothetical protein